MPAIDIVNAFKVPTLLWLFRFQVLEVFDGTKDVGRSHISLNMVRRGALGGYRLPCASVENTLATCAPRTLTLPFPCHRPTSESCLSVCAARTNAHTNTCACSCACACLSGRQRPSLTTLTALTTSTLVIFHSSSLWAYIQLAYEPCSHDWPARRRGLLETMRGG